METSVQTRLGGFMRKDLAAGGRLLMTLGEVAGYVLPASEAPLVTIHDARAMQAAAASEESFFAQHGFVLLQHRSAMTDWGPDPIAPNTQNQIATTYLPEVEALIRDRLLPGRRLEIQQNPGLVRRGVGTPNPQYGNGVHQDLGLTPGDYQEGIEAFSSPEVGQSWRDRYEQDDVEGFVMINFWRTTNMDQPLQHLPLTVCDPNSVDMQDVVPTGLMGFTPTGKPTNQLGLCFNSNQRWYYYPGMTKDEVLAFKIFQSFKSDQQPRLQTCFHSAFADPTAPADAPQRQSCEHRVGVLCLKN